MFQHRRRWNFGAPVLDPVVDAYGPKDVRRKRHGARRDVEGVLLRIFGDLFLFPCPVPVNNIVPIYAGRVAGLVARFAAARKRGSKIVEKDKGSKGEEDERELSSGRWCRPRHECTRHKFYYSVVTFSASSPLYTLHKNGSRPRRTQLHPQKVEYPGHPHLLPP